MKKKTKNNSEISKLLKVLIPTFVGVLLFTSLVIYMVLFSPKVNDKPTFTTGNDGTIISIPTTTEKEPAITTEPDIDIKIDNEYNRKKDFYTFLVCGIDDISLNTDTMMLISLDIANNKINVLQIPRDTFVNNKVGNFTYTSSVNGIYGDAFNKCQVPSKDKVSNQAYNKLYKEAVDKSMNDLCKVLEINLCIEIDRYMLIDTDAFVEVVDAIGGVKYNVPFNMDYEDSEQDLYIHLKAGEQVLSGKDAEGLVRFRTGYTLGDIDRMKVQSDFLKEAFRQVKENIGISNIFTIMGTLINNTNTDVSLDEAIYFARKAYNISSENLEFKTISGSPVQNVQTGVWKYYALNKKGALDDINKYLNVFETKIDINQFDRNGLFTDVNNEKGMSINEYYNS